MERNLEYFKIANELNTVYQQKLLEAQLHIRGNENSFSIISVEGTTAEKGIAGLRNYEKAVSLIENGIIIEKPKRNTPEKVLQSWIISFAMNNSWKLPFLDDILYLTSELALCFPEGKRVNDLLGIDNEGNLCVIELKSKRDNFVKEQTHIFERVIFSEKDFFIKLVEIFSPIHWNGKVRKISVWPGIFGKPRKQKYPEVQEINYYADSSGKGYTFKKI